MATRRRASRWWNAGTLALAVSAAVALLLLSGGMALGYRPLIVRSGSMAPEIAAGDLLVTRLVRPIDVSVGDVVTFRDPSRNGELVTHRVVEALDEGARFSFVTRGDANTGVERWSVHAGGSVGLLALRIPSLGYALAWLHLPAVRAALLLGAAGILALVGLRRVWSDG